MRRLFWTAVVLALISRPFDLRVSAGDSAPLRAVVRVYPDWRTDLRAYVTLTAPLEGREVKIEAVRQAYARGEFDGTTTERLSGRARAAGRGIDSRRDEAIVVVVPADQQDQAVVEAMGDLIYAQFLRQRSLALRPGESTGAQQKSCLFLDALGQPLPNAEVAILISLGNYGPSVPTPRVWIADAQLDAQSRLQPPRSTSGLNRFIFEVVHPDCGPVPAMPQYAAEDEPYHVFKVGALPRDKWCVFVDALDYRMAGAKVEVITSGSWEKGKMTFLDPIILDGAGRLRPPPVFTTLARCSFLVSDANYGIALVEPYSMTGLSTHEPLSRCVVPLIAGGTPMDAGSIWGIVVDADGTPVPQAVINCLRILTPSGESLGPYWPWPAQWNKEVKALTNDRGQFAMYLPLARSDGTPGLPVPAGAVYEVTVTPPAELGYQPYGGRLAAGREHTIMLEGTLLGPKKYSGLLMFEDEYGPVTDPKKISRVNLTVQVRRPNLPTLTYGYQNGEWLEKSALPFGTYEAKVDWDGKHYVFRPIVVRAESPEIIVFKPRKVERFEICYRGRVVHGVNGDPIAGAIVMTAPPSGAKGLGSELDPQSDAFRHLEQHVNGQIARTDPAGRFEIVLPVVPPGSDQALVTLKEGYSALLQPQGLILSGHADQKPRRAGFSVDRSGKAALPDMKLFPVGTVVIEPNVPEDHRGRHVALDFLTADSALWLKELQATLAANLGEGVVYRKDLPLRGRQSVCVPAYVTWTLRMQLPDERYMPTLVEDVLVGQGRTLDLGRIDFARAIPVAVKVVDSAGSPLEGIVVKSLADKSGYPGPGGVTNDEGTARLRVAAHFTGRLIVEYHDARTRTTIREGAPCRLDGQQDAGREFVIQLSDEFLGRLPESQ